MKNLTRVLASVATAALIGVTGTTTAFAAPPAPVSRSSTCVFEFRSKGAHWWNMEWYRLRNDTRTACTFALYERNFLTSTDAGWKFTRNVVVPKTP